MKRFVAFLTVVCTLFAVVRAAAAEGPQDAQTSRTVASGPQLLPPTTVAQQPLAVPPAPAPAEGAPPAKTAPGAKQSDAHLARAKRFLSRRQYELAIQDASRALARDPKDATARAIRAEAYAALGRYEQALSDQNPLEVTVGASRAELKSGEELVAEVPRGTKLLVEDVKDEWLKVASAGDRQFKWAWIHRSDLASAAREPVDLRYRVEVVIPPGGARYYDPYGRPYPYPYYGYYGPRYHDYGRGYYDWWRDVPPQYWRYLPR